MNQNQNGKNNKNIQDQKRKVIIENEDITENCSSLLMAESYSNLLILQGEEREELESSKTKKKKN